MNFVWRGNKGKTEMLHSDVLWIQQQRRVFLSAGCQLEKKKKKKTNEALAERRNVTDHSFLYNVADI